LAASFSLWSGGGISLRWLSRRGRALRRWISGRRILAFCRRDGGSGGVLFGAGTFGGFGLFRISARGDRWRSAGVGGRGFFLGAATRWLGCVTAIALKICLGRVLQKKRKWVERLEFLGFGRCLGIESQKARLT
jgi:hypothetical protein